MKEVACAAIIAGGVSRRMGTPKALLPFEGAPLIARASGVLQSAFAHVVVVTHDEEISRAAGLPLITDEFPGKGPLGGVHAALQFFQKPTFCVACDLPFLRADVIAFLCAQFLQSDNCDGGWDVCAPRVDGRMETLHAIYNSSCLPILEAELQNEKVRGAARVLAGLRLKFVEETELRAFDGDLKFLMNVNTPDELRAAKRDSRYPNLAHESSSNSSSESFQPRRK